jgi:hypothetical protein
VLQNTYSEEVTLIKGRLYNNACGGGNGGGGSLQKMDIRYVQVSSIKNHGHMAKQFVKTNM